MARMFEKTQIRSETLKFVRDIFIAAIIGFSFGVPSVIVQRQTSNRLNDTAKINVIVDVLPLLKQQSDPALIHSTTSEIGEISIPFQLAALSYYGTKINNEIKEGLWPLHEKFTSQKCRNDPKYTEVGLANRSDSTALFLKGWHAAIDALSRIGVEESYQLLHESVNNSVSPIERGIFLRVIEELSPRLGDIPEVASLESLLTDPTLSAQDRGTIISVLANTGKDRIMLPNNFPVDLSCRAIPQTHIYGFNNGFGNNLTDSPRPLILAKTEFAEGTTFNNVEYRSVLFFNTEMKDIVIRNSSFKTSYKLEQFRTSSKPLDISHSYLENVIFGIVDLGQSSFTACRLRDVTFDQTTLVRADLNDSELDNVTLINVEAFGFYLQGIYPDNMRVQDTNIDNWVVRIQESGRRSGRRYLSGTAVVSQGCNGIEVNGITIC